MTSRLLDRPFLGDLRRSREVAATADAGPSAAQLLTVNQAADLLSVSPGTIRNWIEVGSIPYIRLPGGSRRHHYRIPMQGLLGSLEGNYDLAGALRAQHAAAAAELSED